MKNFKISIAWLAVFALVFTSCSKEEAGVVSDNPETVQITFGALLNSFNQQNKQSEAECRDNAVPAYVMLGGSTDPNVIPSANDLIKVGLKNNNGSWETTYNVALELPADTYYLQHFVVYDANDQVLWVAPREGGSFADEVTDALPITVNLVAGTKPYIDVDVLCYIAREEVAFGYPFFDFDVIEVENSYCVFVNYCDSGTGREYPANFRLDVWSDGYGGSNLVTTGVNDVDMDGAWPSASVLCLPLPEIVGEDLYARVTVLNDAQDYTPGAEDIHEFRISQDDLDDLAGATPGYEHFRIGCEDDGNGGGDPTCDIEIACNLENTGNLDPFCYVTEIEGSDDGWVRVDSAEDFILTGTDGLEVFQLANVNASVTAANAIEIDLNTLISETDRILAYSIEVRPSVGEGDGVTRSETCWESECGNLGTGEYGLIENEFSGFEYEYPFYLRVNTISCYEVID